MSNLTKWPGLIILGTPVTQEQAGEIILRTTRFPVMSNQHVFDNKIHEIVYNINMLPAEKQVWNGLNDAIDRITGIKDNWQGECEFKEKTLEYLQPLDLTYLHNSRITSSWIGGTHGWCNWNGQIQCSNYNIGKWPSAEEIEEDLKTIATAFPFLEFTCQIANGEIGAEYIKPLLQFEISNGQVASVTPAETFILTPTEPDWKNVFDHRSEIGCTLAQVQEVVNRLRTRFKELQP